MRCPSAVFEELESRHYTMPVGETDAHNSWVTARFSPHQSQEHILYLGDDPGNIGIFDVRKFHDRSVPIEERQLHFIPAHDGAIMDIVGVPNKEQQIVSISGDSTVRCWDLTQSAADRKSELFYGHEGSVRSICFSPDESNVFATGGRDGKIKLWDMRVSQIKKKDLDCRLATTTYETAHPSSQLEKPAPGTPRSKAKPKYVPWSVTSVLYLDNYHIATASSNAESGIRVWDVRMPTRNGEGRPVRTFRIPTSKGQKTFGVTCMSIDRFGSRIFVSCTNSTIFEYATLSASLEPVNNYSGVKIGDFYTQVACSPVADVIACGSEDNRALMFDLQDQYHYMNDRFLPDEVEKRRTRFPKYSLGGHEKKVLNVGWSANGKYFMSMDEGGVRIWNEPRHRKAWPLNEDDPIPAPETRDLGLSYEQVKPFEMTDPDAAMSCMDSISISPRQRLGSVGSSPQKNRGAKRRIVLTSPFKTIGSPRLLNRSPMAKICK
uniref:WD_REPEATS_REGION domain-containing protein n=1 Tax=Caenorhabditis japonica TaxID=281687 RepID=A0A8R1HGG3_CAEJA